MHNLGLESGEVIGIVRRHLKKIKAGSEKLGDKYKNRGEVKAEF